VDNILCDFYTKEVDQEMKIDCVTLVKLLLRLLERVVEADYNKDNQIELNNNTLTHKEDDLDETESKSIVSITVRKS